MKRALIVYGGWKGHDPKGLAALFKKVLEEENFEVVLSEKLSVFAKLNLNEFNLIVPVWTMGDIKDKEVKAVISAIEGGVGLAGCHGGMCDAFRNNTEWQFLTGSQFVAHPGGGGVEYLVNITKTKHQITEEMKDFKVKTEQYYLHTDPVNEVLAGTKIGEIDMPVVYTRAFGKGKIFYNALGHNAKVFEDFPESLELMRRGFIWAARG